MTTPSIESWMRAMHTPDTQSPYDYYATVFDLPQNDAPMTILDLGSGSACEFAVAPENTRHQIYSISPNLAREGVGMSIERQPLDKLGKKLAALAQSLPFEGSAFDMVVSANAVPCYIRPDERELAYSEAIRIVKPGGIAQFYPYEHASTEPDIHQLADTLGATAHVDMIRDPLEMRMPVEVRAMMSKLLPEARLARLTLSKTIHLL